jgi:hypothetical protein
MPIRQPDTDHLLEFLNELLRVDAVAVTRLLLHREPCGKSLAEHPTVQVNGDWTVSVLGLLNGFCGAYTIDDAEVRDYKVNPGYGPVTAVVEAGLIARFERTDTKTQELVKA